jgi:ArsR family transcriptional regulator, arsenate/arsenite/antimonite-responsive transcriptional repressor
VDLIQIYQCFCDETRLRILHLLTHGPLCVCHFQSLLKESQVKISKHLAYLKQKGVVMATRHQNWMIYSLPETRSPELDKNLQCLQDCVQTEPLFRKDLKALKAMNPDVEWVEATIGCCAKASRGGRSGKRTKVPGGASCR